MTPTTGGASCGSRKSIEGGREPGQRQQSCKLAAVRLCGRSSSVSCICAAGLARLAPPVCLWAEQKAPTVARQPAGRLIGKDDADNASS